MIHATCTLKRIRVVPHQLTVPITCRGLYIRKWRLLRFIQRIWTENLYAKIHVNHQCIWWLKNTSFVHHFNFTPLRLWTCKQIKVLVILCGLVSSVRRTLVYKLRGLGFKSWTGEMCDIVTIIMRDARPVWKLALP